LIGLFNHCYLGLLIKNNYTYYQYILKFSLDKQAEFTSFILSQ